MATADQTGHVIDAGIVSTWDFIEGQAVKVSRNCIGAREGGGFILIAGM